MVEQPAPAPKAGIVDERQEQVLADIRASLAARDLEYAKAVDPEACALLVRMAAEYGLELSFLASGENFTARLTDMRPPNGGSRPVLHFQSWNAHWSGDPGGRGLDVSEVAAWLAAYRAHPTWHPDSLYDDMKARTRSAEVPGPSETTPRHAQAAANSSQNSPDNSKGAGGQQSAPQMIQVQPSAAMAAFQADLSAGAAAKRLSTWRAARAVTEAILTAGRSPEAAGIKVSEGPGHPLVYDLSIPHAIARALGLGAGANELAEEQIGLGLGVAGFVTILRAETGKDFTTVTIRLGSGAPAGAPAAGSAVPASVGDPEPDPVSTGSGLAAAADWRDPTGQFTGTAEASPRRAGAGGPQPSPGGPARSPASAAKTAASAEAPRKRGR